LRRGVPDFIATENKGDRRSAGNVRRAGKNGHERKWTNLRTFSLGRARDNAKGTVTGDKSSELRIRRPTEELTPRVRACQPNSAGKRHALSAMSLCRVDKQHFTIRPVLA
jgi:hypothetical protein